MPLQSALSQAVTTLTRVLRVASGVFAPGHLGELTQIVPFDLVDAVLVETRTVEQRLRDLPSRVGIYFLLAMGLFPEVGYGLVWKKLTSGLKGMPVVGPAKKAFRDLRRRLGSTPVKALFGVLAGCWPGRWLNPRPPGCASAAGARSPSTAAPPRKSPIRSATGPGSAKTRKPATPAWS